MKHLLAILVISATFLACETAPEGGVFNKVMVDWGIREPPEGHVSGADRVMERMKAVGTTEMKRLNRENRHGEVKFQEQGRNQGTHYKEVKVYEQFYPLDANPASKAVNGERGYMGFIEYAYRIYRSPQQKNRVEAEAASATVRTDETGRERYRYYFRQSTAWDGAKGERVKK